MHIDTLLHSFNPEDCKPLAQPLDLHIQFSVDQCPTTIKEKAAMKVVPYQEAVEALNWVAVVAVGRGLTSCLQSAN